MPLPSHLSKEGVAEKKLRQIPTGKKAKTANWIPVAERMPTDDRFVLVHEPFCEMRVSPRLPPPSLTS